MTVAAGKTPFHSYYPGAAMAAEAIPFEFFDAAHLKVRDSVTGTIKTEGTHYSIGGDPRAGTATITALVEVDEETSWQVWSETPRQQVIDLSATRQLPVTVYETELDRRAVIEREADREIARAPKFERGATTIDFGDMSDADGKLLGVVSGQLVPVESEEAEIAQAVADAEAARDEAVDAAGDAEAEAAIAVAAAATAVSASVTGVVFAASGAVAAATTANISLTGEQTIDGISTATSRVLVKDQTDPAENGIYVSAAGAWSRATDMDAAGEVEGTAVYVAGGDTNGGNTYVTYSEVTTLGTDPISWRFAFASSGVQDQINALASTYALQADLEKLAASSPLIITGANIPDAVWPMRRSLPFVIPFSRLKVTAYGTGTLDVAIQRSGGGVTEATEPVTVTAGTNLDTNAFYLVGEAGQDIDAIITNVSAGITWIEVVVDAGEAA